MSGQDEYVRMRGTVIKAERNARFRVAVEGGLEVTAGTAGRMRRGRKIKILPGDLVDIEVSSYDPTKGRIVWRHRADAPPPLPID
ncbi:MAG TPA: translation initiation factor IF-1 [Acidimicrobiia bacterium]